MLQILKSEEKAYDLSTDETQRRLDHLKGELYSKMESSRRDYLKLMRTEFKPRMEAMINDELSIPGLIGDNSKYTTFKSCLNGLDK